MNTDFLKSEDFTKQIQRCGKTPQARLKGLSGILNEWNAGRIGKVVKGEEADLSMSDVMVLRNLVHAEVSRLKLSDIETVSDQILFLVIGAIKLQIQSNSAQPWTLVNHSINAFIKPKSRPLRLYIMLFLLPLCAGFAYMATQGSLFNHKNNAGFFANENPTSAKFNEVGNNTVNNLIAIYNKMKEGDCQLPQVAMLQPQEREAYMMFIKDGKVDINTANDLKSALSHVSCLYPQKLMNQAL